MLRIDLHVHAFPPALFEALWRFFEQRDWQVHREQAKQIAATLSAHGIERAVALSYPHNPQMVRSLNRFMASLPSVSSLFWPFASVHVDDDDLLDTIDEVFTDPALHGFKFQPLVQRFDINDPRLDPLYHRCVAEQFPIIMHAGTAPMANEHVGFAHFRKLMARFADLRICVAHMGGFEFDDFLSLLDDHEQMYLDTTMINVRTDLFDARWRGDPARLDRHADRICFGSDWPNIPYSYSEALDSVARFPLSTDQQQAVLGENAARFLRLPSARGRSFV